MKIKFQELNKVREALVKLTKVNLPIKIGYPIAKFIRETDGDMNFYYDELKKILIEYRDDSNNENVVIKKDKVEEFNSKILELDNQEIEIKEISIDISSIPDNVELTVEDMYWLSLIII